MSKRTNRKGFLEFLTHPFKYSNGFLVCEILQEPSQFPQSFAPMAYPVFLLEAELRHRFPISGKEEEGIVSKPFLADLFKSDSPSAGPLSGHLTSIWRHHGYDAFKPRSPL